MYLKNIIIENNGPIDRFELLEKDIFYENGNPKPVVLAGKNGTGKTILLAQVIDALTLFQSEIFDDVLPNQGVSKSFYKVNGPSDTQVGKEYNFSYLDFLGDKKYQYIEKSGNLTFNDCKEKINPEFNLNNKWDNIGNHKHNTPTSNNKEIEKDFVNNSYCFFPVNRYEAPHWLNEWSKEKYGYIKLKRKFTGKLGKELIITSSLEENKSWILDVFLDSRANVIFKNEGGVIIPTLDDSTSNLMNLLRSKNIIEIILSKILQKEIELNLNYRGQGLSRLKIIDKETKKLLLPSLDNLSSGQSILLNLFINIIRYSDCYYQPRNHKKNHFKSEVIFFVIGF